MAELKPEELARIDIDRMLEKAGWTIVNRDGYAPNMQAVAVREGLMIGNKEADYLLFLEGKAIGVLEAKKRGVNLKNVAAEQAERYTRLCPSWCKSWFEDLPIVVLSNGDSICWRNMHEMKSDYVYINGMLTPKDIKEAVLPNEFFVALPTLRKDFLRDCQFDAISKIEEHFREGHNRVLVEMATGAGKTFTACTVAYRMLNYTPMKRILFLVDRNNLGRQAEIAFGRYTNTEKGETFSNIFGVQRLRSEGIADESNVVISTIQKLFAEITGLDYQDEEDAESDFDEDTSEEVHISGNTRLPKDFFDLIIIDECHRSIYGKWKEVLNYFETARMIGLTATPGEETHAFFPHLASRYSYEDSVAEDVNVGFRVYRIKTQTTENGGVIQQGESVTTITNRTGATEETINKATKKFEKNDLNRSVISPAQIRTVLESYRDAIYTQLYNEPQREPLMEYIPKTLIFALNERHAKSIVDIAREVFPNQDERFVQQITYSSGNSDQLIREFNNEKAFRIAVTVTLVATGTDVPPLEVVLFMRDVNSQQLYLQMRGRGCRTIDDEKLRIVTPNAISKDLFYVVDAVGVTEHEKSLTGGGEGGGPSISLAALLERVSHGFVPDNYLIDLANRLSRINAKSTDEQRDQFSILAHGYTMQSIAKTLFDAVENPFAPLPPFVENGNNPEREKLVECLANNPQARDYLITLNAGFITVLNPGEDVCTYSGFSLDDARKITSAFEQYVEEQKDSIEALRIIRQNKGKITYEMLKDLQSKLLAHNSNFSCSILWKNYAILNPNAVTTFSDETEKDLLTNLIQLVRYAYKQCEQLETLWHSGKRYFNLWCGQVQRNLTAEQTEIMNHIANYILANGFCDFADVRNNDTAQAMKLITIFGNKEKTEEALLSLSNFMIYQKAA